MENIYQNKVAFLNEKPKDFRIIMLLFSILLLLILGVCYKTKVSDHYITKGYVDCTDGCKIIVNIPSSINIEEIKINNKVQNLKVLAKSLEIDQETLTSYYTYYFQNNLDLADKEIIELNISFNKQRVLKKFIKKFF